jgi:hypothetical protein
MRKLLLAISRVLPSGAARLSFGSNDIARPGTILNCENYSLRASDLLRRHAGDNVGATACLTFLLSGTLGR